MRKVILAILMVGLFLSGCVYVDMDIQNQPVSKAGISTMKRFSIVESTGVNDALTGKLNEIAKADLVKNGYIYDADNPEFSVVIRYGSKAVYSRGTSYNRDGWGYNLLDRGYSNEGRTTDDSLRTYNNQVKIFMIVPGTEDEPEYLWHSTATSSDREGVGVMGPCLVKGALSHFPGEIGTYSEKIALKNCEK